MKTKVEIPETILRKHIASMKITNKLWDAIIKAMEEYSKENLREELGKVWRFMAIDGNDRKTIDEYLKQKQFK